MTEQQKPGFISGFTLIEVSVALSISILVGGIVYSFWLFGMRTAGEGTSGLFLQGRVRRNLDKLIRELRCARFVNEINKNRIMISRFYDKDTEPNSSHGGGQEFKKVEYFVRKVGKMAEFVRKEYSEEKVMFRCNSIAEGIFTPYYESPKEKKYYPFDMVENDSDQRRKITFIRLRFSLKQRRKTFRIYSSVTLRTPHKLLNQPNWNRKL
ncbi:PilW family protein [Candidatus Riflebacteria bacterium]